MALHANPFGQLGGLLPSIWQETISGGDVVGPSSSTDNAVARFDNTTGKLIQDSSVIITDTGDLSANSLSASGTVLAGTGVGLSDTDQDAYLFLLCGSDLTAQRNLTFITGDASRSLTITADSSIGGTAYVSGGTDVVVADGGTGRSSHTEYAVICGGTSTTGAQQSVASVGTFGQVLSSAGAGALPTFKGGLMLLATATASSSATVDFTLTGWTNSNFIGYLVVLDHIAPSVDGAGLFLRTSTNGGSSYDAGASDYAWTTWLYNTGTGVVGDAADTALNCIYSTGNAANELSSMLLWLSNPSTAQYFSCFGIGQYTDGAGTTSGFTQAGRRLAASDVDAIRFLMNSGNIASGEFRLYGISNT